MSAYFLTWNQAKWPHYDVDVDVERVRQGEVVECKWSSGNSKKIRSGDRIFFLRQGKDRGLLGCGFTTSHAFYDDHWDDERRRRGEKALHVLFEWESVVSVENRLLVEKMQQANLGVNWNSLYASGIQVPEKSVGKLEQLWLLHLRQLGIDQPRANRPDEVSDPAYYLEGSLRRVWVNAYERNTAARDACLAEHGHRCSVCDFDFAEVYGDIGEGFIHVHHLKELSSIRTEYRLMPERDLRPVCPNCHAMLHRRTPAFSIEELRRRLRRS